MFWCVCVLPSSKGSPAKRHMSTSPKEKTSVFLRDPQPDLQPQARLLATCQGHCGLKGDKTTSCTKPGCAFPGSSKNLPSSCICLRAKSSLSNLFFRFFKTTDWPCHLLFARLKGKALIWNARSCAIVIEACIPELSLQTGFGASPFARWFRVWSAASSCPFVVEAANQGAFKLISSKERRSLLENVDAFQTFHSLTMPRWRDWHKHLPTTGLAGICATVVSLGLAGYTADDRCLHRRSRPAASQPAPRWWCLATQRLGRC
eukprot:g39734.t1